MRRMFVVLAAVGLVAGGVVNAAQTATASPAIPANVALRSLYTGADTDGDRDPGALIAGMGYEGFARMVVEDVRQLRQDYNEALETWKIQVEDQ